ncbi:class I SAM-dependent methyltransferase [Virgibacillus sp. W0181]|uniref:class I SAM-dependent methyltransferase n=1 Tax=Virgibacillus sp. W0181 TaxID=3391581 RepID=UPI003F45D76C
MNQPLNWQRAAEEEWDERAHFWNERSKKMWDTGSRRKIIPFFNKHVNNGKAILDVGCGDGYGSLQLSKSGYDVTAVDISKEMITLARNHRQQKDINFLQSDVAKLPFADGSFAGILSINVLEWTEDPLAALKEIQRVLQVNGHLCIGILGPTAGPRINSYARLYGNQVICNTMMPWEFMQLALENGWEYVDGFGVYKEGIKESHYSGLPLELKQALTFMWVFMLRKGKNDEPETEG